MFLHTCKIDTAPILAAFAGCGNHTHTHTHTLRRKTHSAKQSLLSDSGCCGIPVLILASVLFLAKRNHKGLDYCKLQTHDEHVVQGGERERKRELDRIRLGPALFVLCWRSIRYFYTACDLCVCVCARAGQRSVPTTLPQFSDAPNNTVAIKKSKPVLP